MKLTTFQCHMFRNYDDSCEKVNFQLSFRLTDCTIAPRKICENQRLISDRGKVRSIVSFEEDFFVFLGVFVQDLMFMFQILCSR